MFQPDGPTFLELVQQALSSTDRGYDLLAPKFDRTPFRTPEPVIEAAAAIVGGPNSVDSALDLCCGTGAAIGPLRTRCRRRVVGLDRSGGMLRQARLRHDPAGDLVPIELVRGDALALPFGRVFDVVTCFGAFGHILPNDEDRLVAEVARVLVPGGRFVFATTELPPWWSPGRLLARGFNGVMHVRNALLTPPFVMYYLTFLWPTIDALLRRHGLEPVAHRGLLPWPFGGVLLVVATRREG